MVVGRPMAPNSYKIKRKGVDVKEPHVMNAGFKSGSNRFGDKKGPVVDFWGWNYSFKTISNKVWELGFGPSFTVSDPTFACCLSQNWHTAQSGTFGCTGINTKHAAAYEVR